MFTGTTGEEPDTVDADDKSKKPKTKEEMEKGVEMSQDFSGEMHDIPDDASQGEESDEDKGEEQNLDREIGDADIDDVVDEKRWDDNNSDYDLNEKDQSEKEKFEKNSQMQGDLLEDETHTKEKDDEDNKEKDDFSKKAGSQDKSAAEFATDDSNQQEVENDERNDDDMMNSDDEDKYMDKPLGLESHSTDDDDVDTDRQNGECVQFRRFFYIIIWIYEFRRRR